MMSYIALVSVLFFVISNVPQVQGQTLGQLSYIIKWRTPNKNNNKMWNVVTTGIPRLQDSGNYDVTYTETKPTTGSSTEVDVPLTVNLKVPAGKRVKLVANIQADNKIQLVMSPDGDSKTTGKSEVTYGKTKFTSMTIQDDETLTAMDSKDFVLEVKRGANMAFIAVAPAARIATFIALISTLWLNVM
eukprot:Platyproteum_vivax@DN3978_c0_g1_i2.p1